MQGWFDIWKVSNTIHHINRLNKKYPMDILIDTHRKTDKLQHPFMIKPLSKIGIEGNYLNSIKNIYQKPYSYITLMVKSGCFTPQIRNKARKFTPITLIQHSGRSFGQCSKTRKWNTRRETGREEIILFHVQMTWWSEYVSKGVYKTSSQTEWGNSARLQSTRSTHKNDAHFYNTIQQSCEIWS